MPTSNVKLNCYGNLADGQGCIKRLLAKKNTFQGTINGVAGVWQRPKRGKRSRGDSGTIGQSGLKLLVAYESSTQYQLGLISTELLNVALEQILARKWIRL